MTAIYNIFHNLQKGWPDFSKVPTRQAFADIADKAFTQLDVAKVAHRVVPQQNHANSETNPLFEKHYHMVIKLYDDLDGVEYATGVKLRRDDKLTASTPVSNRNRSLNVPYIPLFVIN